MFFQKLFVSIPLTILFLSAAPSLRAEVRAFALSADRVEIDGNRGVVSADGRAVLEAGEARVRARRLDVSLGRREAHAWDATADRDGALWASSDWLGLNWSGTGAPRLFDRLGYLPAAPAATHVAALPLP